MAKLDDLRITAGATARASSAPTSGLPLSAAVAGGTPPRYQGLAKDREAQLVPADMIVPDPDQPRKDFDGEDLARLAASFRRFGQLQPIVVRWVEAIGRYMVIVGERRWRAAVLAGKASVRAIVHDRELSPEEIFDMQMAENLHRIDPRPVEQAHAYRRIMETRGWSLRQVADHLEIAHSSVARTLELLGLPPSVQDAVEAGKIGPTVAIELAPIGDPAVQQEVAQAVVEGGLSRTEVRELVRSIRSRRPAPASTRPEPWSLEVEPGVTVSVRWRKDSPTTAIQAMRKAIRTIQDGGKAAG